MTRLETRVRACWRVQGCAAGLCVGAQIFLLGAGIAMPIALGGAWIASLAALPMAALTTALCRRALVLPRRGGHLTIALDLLLSLTLLANAALALTALVDLAGQTLLVQARALWIAAVTLAAAALAALTGGARRLCFALRGALLVLLPGLTLLCVPMKLPSGLFPILGAGTLPLGVAALCMLSAASPLLMLLLPPPELERAGEAARRCPVPGTGFFLVRVLPGAAMGVLLLFAASVLSTYEALMESGEWGMRLRIVTQARGGLLPMLLILCEMTAMALLSICMLSAAEQALLRALPCARRGRAGLWAQLAVLAALLALPIVFGDAPVLFAAPLLVLPTAALLLLHRRMGGKSA